MKVHNRPENTYLLTEKQWAKKGRVLNESAKGETMWTNQFCQQAYQFFDISETHEATAEELALFWKPQREKQNAKQKQRREEIKKQIADLEQLVNTYETILVELLSNSVYMQEISSDNTAETIVIDTETTGLEAGYDEILQVSIIDDLGNTLYNQLLKPIKATEWKGAERVNHISPDMVKDCPNIYEEMPKINAILRNAKTLIGYNTSGADIRFLECFGADFSNIEKFIDVMFDFAEIYGEWSDYYESYKWQKLTTCADYYGYDWETERAHDSLADCRATLFCYKAMCNKTKREENDQ